MKAILFSGMLCLLLGACVTTKLAGESESSIRTISLDTKVKVPENPIFIGPAAMLGAIGGAITYKAGQRLAEYMRQNEVDIGEIVLEEFEKQVKEHPRFVSKQFVHGTDNVDARFELEVASFGLSQIHGLSSQYRPILNVQARLISAQGKKLWERYDFVTAANSSIPSLTSDEYFSNPAHLREAYKEVANRVVALLMKNL
jgi:hypothetical protein